MLKRIGLFLITNILIMIVASVVLSLFGFTGELDAQGVNLDYAQVALLSGVFWLSAHG